MRKHRSKVCRLVWMCVAIFLLCGTFSFASVTNYGEGHTTFGAFLPAIVRLSSESLPPDAAADDFTTDIACLDISHGSVYISDSGYRIGEGTEEISFHGVYKITGKSQEDYGIKIVGGEHTVILDNMSIDQRTQRQCYPLIVEKDSVLHLYLRGENTLFAGSGYGGITLYEGAHMDIRAFGHGTLSLLAYPEKNGDVLIGTSAIEIGKDASVSYPCGQGNCDEVIMHAGPNRLSSSEISEYEDQPYLKIQYFVDHECRCLSKPADCTHGQFCLECGREVAPRTDHVPGTPATCTQPQRCEVCQAVLCEPRGHRGVWKAENRMRDGKCCHQETMICTVCGEVLVREAADH